MCCLYKKEKKNLFKYWSKVTSKTCKKKKNMYFSFFLPFIRTGQSFRLDSKWERAGGQDWERSSSWDSNLGRLKHNGAICAAHNAIAPTAKTFITLQKMLFLFIKESWKITCIAVNQKCFSAYYYDFWRSRDTEDWSNDAENTAEYYSDNLHNLIK